MSAESVVQTAKQTAVFTVPPVLGFVLDVNLGVLAGVLTVVAAFAGQLVWQVSSAKAKAYKEWVEAENARTLPQLEQARVERAELRGRIQSLEAIQPEFVKATAERVALMDRLGDIERMIGLLVDAETCSTPGGDA